MSRTLVLLSFLVLSLPTTAQSYWQQHVKYKIDVTLLDSIHSLRGTLAVDYTNNSPDTLSEINFHLYYLAFQPGSMMDVRSREINASRIWSRIQNLPPDEQGKYAFESVRVGGKESQSTVTGTILRVPLPSPLVPGGKTTIELTYLEQIPRQTRRGGWASNEGVEYSMAQWYPKVCEYDEEGWHTQEYIGREFYGVWGDFDVAITLPSSFTVAATGHCINPDEVGRGYERIAKGEKVGEAQPERREGMTTWKWQARNVHDFAWTADRNYVHAWTTWRDTITIHALYKSSVAPLWTNALKYTEHALETFSELYGDYPYRDFYNTHAGDGGMEYPQLIMITGYRGDGSLAGVTAHEVAHQWFYGILANNESREAYLDEGFTSFATDIAMKRLWKRHPTSPKRSWLDWFIPSESRKGSEFLGHQWLAKAEYQEPLSIPHDWFREDVNAGEVYGKTSAILSMLEYTLGDAVFDRGMKRYFQQWKFKHPKLRDYQKVMEETAKTDLDWFFDQWFRTTRTADYTLCDVDSEEQQAGFVTTVEVRNLEQAVMPIDLTLHYTDGSVQEATIPLGFHHNAGYIKQEEGRLIFPVWDWVARTYRGSIVTPKPVAFAEIDASMRLQDLNRLNNARSSGLLNFPRGYWALWKQLNINSPLDGYYAIVRPILGIRKPVVGLGIKYGANLHGNGDIKAYYIAPEFTRYREGVVEGRITGTEPIEWLGRLTKLNYFAGALNDLASTKFSVSKTIRPEYYNVGPTNTLSVYLESHDRLFLRGRSDHPLRLGDRVWDYIGDELQSSTGWQSEISRVAGISYQHVSESREWTFDAYVESSILNSDHDFMRVRITGSYSIPVTGRVRAVTRINLGGSLWDLPAERWFNYDIADIATHQFSDTYQAWSTWPVRGEDVRIRGGAGVPDALKLKTEANERQPGYNMLALNLDVVDIPVPYISFATIIARGGIGWVGRNLMSLDDLWRQTRVGGSIGINIDLVSLLPWQLQGVAQQYAPLPPVISSPDPLMYVDSKF